VKVRVLEVDPKSRKDSLSIKREDEPVIAAAASPGSNPTQPKKKQQPARWVGLDW